MGMMMTTKARATAHLRNYAAASGMTLGDLLDRYMEGNLKPIKVEAIGLIMARYDGVTASDVYADLNGIEG